MYLHVRQFFPQRKEPRGWLVMVAGLRSLALTNKLLRLLLDRRTNFTP